MPKILHISNTDITSDSRILKELQAFASVSSFNVFAIGVPDGTNYTKTTVAGSSYYQTPMRSRLLSFLPRAARYAIELIEFTISVVAKGRRIRPDIVHCHDTFALPAGWLLNKLYGSKLVYDAHELESNKNGQNVILSKATLLIERFCWPQIDLLVSVSDSITDWYMKNLGAKPNVLVLNSPMLAMAASPNENNKRYFNQHFNIPNDHLVFVYLGILGVGRGIETCLHAFASGPLSAHVVFIGYGQLETQIKDKAQKHPNIHFHPPVRHDEVVSLVSNAHYGLCLVENVSLSDFYCLPNKLFEYSFAKIPVLASQFPEITKIVSKYNLGVCCDPNPASVQQALETIITNKPTFSPADISDLSWETQAQRLIDAYQRYLLNR